MGLLHRRSAPAHSSPDGASGPCRGRAASELRQIQGQRLRGLRCGQPPSERKRRWGPVGEHRRVTWRRADCQRRSSRDPEGADPMMVKTRRSLRCLVVAVPLALASPGAPSRVALAQTPRLKATITGRSSVYFEGEPIYLLVAVRNESVTRQEVPTASALDRSSDVAVRTIHGEDKTRARGLRRLRWRDAEGHARAGGCTSLGRAAPLVLGFICRGTGRSALLRVRPWPLRGQHQVPRGACDCGRLVRVPGAGAHRGGRAGTGGVLGGRIQGQSGGAPIRSDGFGSRHSPRLPQG